MGHLREALVQLRALADRQQESPPVPTQRDNCPQVYEGWGEREERRKRGKEKREEKREERREKREERREKKEGQREKRRKREERREKREEISKKNEKESITGRGVR